MGRWSRTVRYWAPSRTAIDRIRGHRTDRGPLLADTGSWIHHVTVAFLRRVDDRSSVRGAARRVAHTGSVRCEPPHHLVAQRPGGAGRGGMSVSPHRGRATRGTRP